MLIYTSHSKKQMEKAGGEDKKEIERHLEIAAALMH